MFKVIDLTTTHVPGLTIPGHPVCELNRIHAHAEYGRSNTSILTSLHVGTHIDSPFHFHADLPSIDRIPLEKLMGPAVVVNLKGQIEPGEAVSAAKVKGALPQDASLAGKIVVLYSGWKELKYEKAEEYYGQNPALGADLVQWLIAEKIKMICLDMPPDFAEPGGPRPGDGPSHRTLLAAQIPIVENCANFDQLTKDEYFVVAAPIKVLNGDGGLARLFALEGIAICY